MTFFSTILASDSMSARVVVPLLVFLLGACSEQRSGAVIHELSGQTMGTSFSVKLVSPGDDLDKTFLAQRVNTILENVNNGMSTWLPDSELSVFNANPSTDWIETSQEFCDVIAAAINISDQTNGAFDLTVGPFVNLWGFGPGASDVLKPPTHLQISTAASQVGFRKLRTDCGIPAVRKARADVYIDLSAYAKGYAVDQIANGFDELGLDNYLVEIGGELRMRGRNASNHEWAIAIEKPADFDRAVQLIIHLTDQAMATSGDYRNFFEFDGKRFSHTIDARSGRPVAHRVAAVTVVAKSAAEADALATALLVLGPEEGLAFAEKKRIPAYFLLRNEAGIEEQMTTPFAALQAR